MRADGIDLKLGLIGDNIARSQSPRLHLLAGQRVGKGVSYIPLVPKELGRSFEDIFALARAEGYRGLNITYPYKERVVPLLRIDDPVVRAIGAVNTVLFDPDGPRGFNTDFTGFKAAFRAVMPDRAPGATLLIGAGGVGRAIAFGLAGLGAEALHLVDRDPAKAEMLAADMRRGFPGLDVHIHGQAERAAEGMSGLVNATPVGMAGLEGSPLSATAMEGALWAFDAVYTPKDTAFLADAAARGLTIVSGWELFFFQGLHAWEYFSGQPVEAAWLRAALLDAAPMP